MSKCVLVSLCLALGLAAGANVVKGPEMKKLTPILVVDRVEPAVEFWVHRLGLEKTASVNDGDRMAFAIIAGGGIEIMYQTRASIEKDSPKVAERIGKSGTCLYIEVESLDPIEEKLGDIEIVSPRRDMFYGMTEIGIREPGGHFVTFAQKTTKEPEG